MSQKKSSRPPAKKTAGAALRGFFRACPLLEVHRITLQTPDLLDEAYMESAKKLSVSECRDVLIQGAAKDAQHPLLANIILKSPDGGESLAEILHEVLKSGKITCPKSQGCAASKLFDVYTTKGAVKVTGAMRAYKILKRVRLDCEEAQEMLSALIVNVSTQIDVSKQAFRLMSEGNVTAKIAADQLCICITKGGNASLAYQLLDEDRVEFYRSKFRLAQTVVNAREVLPAFTLLRNKKFVYRPEADNDEHMEKTYRQAQEELAKCIFQYAEEKETSYALTLLVSEDICEEAQVWLAKKVANDMGSNEAFLALSANTVTSSEAWGILAQKVYEAGTPDQVTEVQRQTPKDALKVNETFFFRSPD